MHNLCNSSPMSLSVRKYIAVLLAIWLPLFSGSVLATSVSMQLHNSTSAVVISHDDVMEQGCEQQSVNNGHPDKKCTACGVCHLACSGYLTVSELIHPTVQLSDVSGTHYLLSFNSTTSIPLLPPPLARA